MGRRFAAMAGRQRARVATACIRGNRPAHARPHSRSGSRMSRRIHRSLRRVPVRRRGRQRARGDRLVFGLVRGYVLSAIELDEVEQLVRSRAAQDALTLNADEASAGSAASFHRRQAPPMPKSSSRASEHANRETTVTQAGSTRSPAAARDASPCLAVAHGSPRDAQLDHPTERDSRVDWWRAASDPQLAPADPPLP